ncbi:hypothetical protein CEUSTIGMA_g9006.t1 [Chlamydomonas eustigma]|uniref:RING-type domain-containing protein n=1 Tax=Chlamydomonas eustigma TaxID=1157962 RepID=A0A250XES9_9CHLO|nr:hypothetical protein CEUSTIGMA_g9006.t1 [Chlamydomonas eustigma]|eukprot:GAX81578.1 hypothetical protein CEUSTIGMA_g9006.t1 [Chlamydomonas eustigma]
MAYAYSNNTTTLAASVVFASVFGILFLWFLYKCCWVAMHPPPPPPPPLRTHPRPRRPPGTRPGRAPRLLVGVPGDVINSFPVRDYVPLRHVSNIPKIDRDLKSRRMMAAMSVLRMPSAALYAGNTVDLPEGAAMPPSSDKQSSMSRTNMQSNLRSTSGRVITGAKSFVRTLGPTHVGTLVGSMIRSQAPLNSAAYASGQPWEVEHNERDEISPDMVLAAAQQASCALNNQGNGVQLPRKGTLPHVSKNQDGDLEKGGKGGYGDGDEEDMQCPICLCDFEAGEKLRQLPCKHDFHQPCIDSWMCQHLTCPLCRFVLWVPPPVPTPASLEESDGAYLGEPLPPPPNRPAINGFHPN